MRRWDELVAATMLLTRLPVARLARSHPDAAACVWAYPVVGLMVGAIGAAVWAVLRGIGVPGVVAATWAVLAMVAVTGALHEDGLADSADGLGGGRTLERKLAIMRDSRIGSYGALALCASLLLRVLCLAAAPHPVLALLWSAVLGRASILVPVLLLRPARPDGLAAMLHGRRGPAMIGLGLTILLFFVAPKAVLAAALASLAVTWLGRRHLGGYTGDLLGAAEQAGECASLTALSLSASAISG